MIQRLWEETLQSFAAVQNKIVVHCNELDEGSKTNEIITLDKSVNKHSSLL